MQIPRIDPENLGGLVDKIVGLGKEVVGTLTGQDRLTEAGQTQQDKGTERLKAVQAELRADVHESKATAAEQAQRAAQKTKEKVNS
jgi:uncharacterized protein YjbJ (UPF0337 family)